MINDVEEVPLGLRAPFPWWGGKSLAAPMLWRAFGNVPNLVEPFCGSLATLLARPHQPKVETANDADGFIANFWRAVKHAPEETAEWCDWPVNEADLHARHAWLVNEIASGPLLERLIADPDFYDAKIAGWWVWGICQWIGNGWCSRDERLHRCLPRIGVPGNGVHSPGVHVPGRKKPLTHRNKGFNADGAGDTLDLFRRLQARLRRVRICCGDWTRVLGRSTLGIDTEHGMTPCAVLLDPPYTHESREKRLYREDSADVSQRVRAWAIENGDNPKLRIALCGFEEEHADEMPKGWTMGVWKSTSSSKSRKRERVWFSPHCLPHEQQRDLLSGLEFAEP